MDVGKQCVGSMLCHWLNIIFSIVFVASAATNDDEVWLCHPSLVIVNLGSS